MDQFAIKRLTVSDLTVLATHHGVVAQGNQKAINFDQRVFVKRLYPVLGEVLNDHRAKVTASKASGGTMPKPKAPRFEVELYAGGPDGHTPVASFHHIGLYDKNWRLNGAFIRPPANEPKLYEELEEGDFAVLGFAGSPLPTQIGLLWVKQNGGVTDPLLHAALQPLIGSSSMREVTATQLQAAISNLALPPSHALFAMMPDAAFEAAVAAAVETGPAAIKTVVSAPRIVTAATLEKIQKAKAANGLAGEVLVNVYLSADTSLAVDWVSSKNTLAPMDFQTTEVGSGLVNSVDVKTTAGGHNTPFHLSMGEAEEAASSPHPYRIYRVSSLDAVGGTLRISEDITPFAQALLSACSNLPTGSAAESFVIQPQAWGIGWGEPIKVKHPDP